MTHEQPGPKVQKKGVKNINRNTSNTSEMKGKYSSFVEKFESDIREKRRGYQLFASSLHEKDPKK